MKPEKLELWVADEVLDDRHSFTELFDYFTFETCNENELFEAVSSLYAKRYVEVEFLTDGETFQDREFQSISQNKQNQAIDQFLKIANDERNNMIYHWLSIADTGIEYLKKHGIYLK